MKPKKKVRLRNVMMSRLRKNLLVTLRLVKEKLESVKSRREFTLKRDRSSVNAVERVLVEHKALQATYKSTNTNLIPANGVGSVSN